MLREPTETTRNHGLERVTSTNLVDLSGLPPYYVEAQIRELRGRALRIVTLPDLGPTERGIVPTGSVSEFDSRTYPEWLRHVRGADIGCGMTRATIPGITAGVFLADQGSLDELYRSLKDRSDEVSLGGGNHFMDFVENKDGGVEVVIHTGSFGDRQVELGKLVEQMEREGRLADVDRYMAMYEKVIESGTSNRAEILRLVEEVYGKVRTSQDLIHNTIEFSSVTGVAVVYKGAINVARIGAGTLLLPSSMTDEMIVYQPGEMISASNLWAAPHGTGREVPRGKVDKDTFLSLFGDGRGKVDASYIGDIREGASLMVPTGMGLPVTELPFVYRDLEREIGIMQSGGLMGGIIDRLWPIAYLGHI